MTRGRAWLVVAQLVVATAVLSAANEVVRIQVFPSTTGLSIGLSARDAWSIGSREALQSAVPLRYEYDIKLGKQAALWFLSDTTLARVNVSALASFDTLRGDYRASRLRGGATFTSIRLKTEADVREWLTVWDKIVLDPVTPLEPNEEYYVDALLTIRPEKSVSMWSILPFTKDKLTGRKTFTFIKQP